jgi:hypothetical protein
MKNKGSDRVQKKEEKALLIVRHLQPQNHIRVP